jgi:hypothetical protein
VSFFSTFKGDIVKYLLKKRDEAPPESTHPTPTRASMRNGGRPKSSGETPIVAAGASPREPLVRRASRSAAAAIYAPPSVARKSDALDAAGPLSPPNWPTPAEAAAMDAQALAKVFAALHAAHTETQEQLRGLQARTAQGAPVSAPAASAPQAAVATEPAQPVALLQKVGGGHTRLLLAAVAVLALLLPFAYLLSSWAWGAPGLPPSDAVSGRFRPVSVAPAGGLDDLVDQVWEQLGPRLDAWLEDRLRPHGAAAHGAPPP